jgi:hypothetical protein
MRRNTLIMGIGGALAVAAIVGTAISANAAEGNRQGLGSAPVTTPGTGPTGTPSTGPTGTPTGTPTTGPSGSPGPTGTAPAAGEVSSQRAVEIALASIGGGGRLDEVEREQEHGRTVWSVEFVTDGGEIEVDVDATTGEIVKTDRDSDDDDRDDDDEDGDDD